MPDYTQRLTRQKFFTINLIFQGQNTLQWRTFTVTLSTLQEKGDFNEAAVEFKHPLFQLELNTKHNGRSFTRYSVNASENGSIEAARVF